MASYSSPLGVQRTQALAASSLIKLLEAAISPELCPHLPPSFRNHRCVALFAYPSSPPRSCWHRSLGGCIIDQPSWVDIKSRALFLPSSEPLFHNHRCIFLTSVATAFVPRSSVQELRRRILSSVREIRRCILLTAFTTAFVLRPLVRELPRCSTNSSIGGFIIDHPSWVIAKSRALFLPSSEPLFHNHRCVFLASFAIAFVPRSSVQKLRRRILSSVREHHQCTRHLSVLWARSSTSLRYLIRSRELLSLLVSSWHSSSPRCSCWRWSIERATHHIQAPIVISWRRYCSEISASSLNYVPLLSASCGFEHRRFYPGLCVAVSLLDFVLQPSSSRDNQGAH